MDIFDAFELTPYTFLEIESGAVEGNIIKSQTQALGVFKLRAGITKSGTQTTEESTATLHIRPDESFIANGLKGNGIIVEGESYRIEGVTGGDNFETGEREHYTLTLQATDYSELEGGS